MKSKQTLTKSWDPVYRLVKQVPRGRVITYGEVASRLRFRGGARAVGYAMAACPRGRGIPWHRVVGAGGRILLREPVSGLQRKLLESEGVKFLETRVDIRTHSWLKTPGKRRGPRKAR
jgi:methylated-DNA-protein-cysteine methyltransferase-like protein